MTAYIFNANLPPQPSFIFNTNLHESFFRRCFANPRILRLLAQSCESPQMRSVILHIRAIRSLAQASVRFVYISISWVQENIRVIRVKKPQPVFDGLCIMPISLSNPLLFLTRISTNAFRHPPHSCNS